MKKILAILDSVVPYGKERSNVEVYRLIKERLDVRLDIVTNRKANKGMMELMSGLDAHPVVVPNRHSKRLRLFTYLSQYIVANIQVALLIIHIRPDILMMNSEITFYNFYPALLLFRGKILYRIGDGPGVYRGLSFRRYNEYVWKNYILKRLTKCVFISHYIKNEMEKAGRDTSGDTLIYNYPPTRKKSDGKDEKRYKQTEGVTFGYLGQIISIKGVHHFVKCAIKILETHPDMLFYVAGSLNYDPVYAKQTVDMVPQKFKDSIIFLGEITDIETFFSHIEVLCVPSIKLEPLGNVIVEAKKYSRPCIVYPHGGMPELIQSGVDGYVCERADEKALMECMNHYLGNKALAKEHGANSKKSIDRLQIGRKPFERKWLSVFRELGI